MTSPPVPLYPKIAELPGGPEGVVLALDCEGLLAPRGPIPLPGAILRPSVGLSAELLAQIGPDCILLPLFAGPCDALGVIERLEDLGYGGRILVIAPPLPRPALVERELRAAGPGERLTLVCP